MDHQDTNDQLTERVAMLEKRLGQLTTLNAAYADAARKAPALEAAREEGLLPKFAIALTRLRAVEEAHHELTGIVVELFAMMRTLEEMRGRDAGPSSRR